MMKVIFVGQAMPRVKRNPHDWPSFNAWLFSIDVTEEQIKNNFLYSALVDYFPGSQKGSHLVPTRGAIETEKERLHKTLLSFNPDVVVPIGKLSISYCLDEKIDKLKDYIGKTFKQDPYKALKKDVLIVPLPHPSGASTWRHKKENKVLLDKALELLKKNLK